MKKIQKLIKLISRQKRHIKRAFKFVVFRNSYSKAIRRTLKLEAHIALLKFAKFSYREFMIRPRAKFVTALVLALIITYFATSRTVAYIDAKKAGVKVNGHQVLVADKSEDQSRIDPQLSHAVVSKLSPFDFEYPVQGGYISQGYRPYHRAIDIATGFGSPIKSLGTGKVEFAGRVKDGHGNFVVIEHSDGFKSTYAHMGKIYVKTGNSVTSDTVIGTVGLTGRTTGAHLHLEIYDGEEMIDPAKFLPSIR